MDQETICLCALNRLYGFEPRAGLRLLELFGSAGAVFEAGTKEIRERTGPGFPDAERIGESAFDAAAMELEMLAGQGCTFLGIGSPGYPELLLECQDPPLGLYFKGGSPPEEVFNTRPALAVVGTRDISPYGREWCRRIVDALSRASGKPLLVSGLALGTDITAQAAALDGGMPTVSVMATGIDEVYPSRHTQIAARIASTPGCALVTDYPPRTPPLKVNFLRRNRIIAGMCRMTILVESRIKGGGMMTARLASSYDREVWALPGRVDDPRSQGCNLLIRENIARQVGDLGELVGELGLGKADLGLKEDFKAGVEAFYRDRLDGAAFGEVVRVAVAVKGHRGLSLDDLCVLLKWPYSKVSRYTGLLECDGFISIDLLQKCSANVRKSC